METRFNEEKEEKRISPRNKAFKGIMKISRLKFQTSKAYLAYSLAVEPRSNTNPRRTLFVECFFEPVKGNHYRALGLYASNLHKYAKTINKLGGDNKLIVVKKMSPKNCFYFVDLTKEPFNPYSEVSDLNKKLKELSPNKNAPNKYSEWLEGVWNPQNSFNRVSFYLNAFFYCYTGQTVLPLRELEKIKTLEDLKQDLDNRLKNIETGFDFFNTFMVPKWLQDWRSDFWVKLKTGGTPVLPLDRNLHAEKKAREILNHNKKL